MGERVVTVGGRRATRPISYVRPTGVGGSYIKTDAGVKTLAIGTKITKKVMIVCKVTEVFAAGTGTEPTIKIGEVGSDAKFAATSIFTAAALGATFTFAGSLTASTDLIATLTAATGTGTGAIDVTAFIVPAA